MIIIFEGVDNTGKTSIAKALANRYYLSYFKNESQDVFFRNNSREFAFIEANYLFNLMRQTHLAKEPLILDRHMPSEFVYSKVYNRPLDLDRIFHVDKKLSKLNAGIIYCYKDSFEDFEDKFVDKTHLNKLKEAYEEYFEKTAMKVLRLNTTNEDLETQLSEIKKFMKELI